MAHRQQRRSESALAIPLLALLICAACSDGGSSVNATAGREGAGELTQGREITVELPPVRKATGHYAMRLLPVGVDSLLIGPGVDARDSDGGVQPVQAAPFIIVDGKGKALALDGTIPPAGSSSYPLAVHEADDTIAVLSGICETGEVGKLPEEYWAACAKTGFRLTLNRHDGSLIASEDLTEQIDSAWAAAVFTDGRTVRVSAQPVTPDGTVPTAVSPGLLRTWEAPVTADGVGKWTELPRLDGVLATQFPDQSCFTGNGTQFALATAGPDTFTALDTPAIRATLLLRSLGDANWTTTSASIPSTGAPVLACTHDHAIVLAGQPQADSQSTLASAFPDKREGPESAPSIALLDGLATPSSIGAVVLPSPGTDMVVLPKSAPDRTGRAYHVNTDGPLTVTAGDAGVLGSETIEGRSALMGGLVWRAADNESKTALRLRGLNPLSKG